MKADNTMCHIVVIELHDIILILNIISQLDQFLLCINLTENYELTQHILHYTLICSLDFQLLGSLICCRPTQPLLVTTLHC